MNVLDSAASEQGYSIRLSGGQEWHLIGSGWAELWVDRLASIMGLDPYGTQPMARLLVRPWNSGGSVFSDLNPCWESDGGSVRTLPRTGWRTRYPALFRVIDHPEVKDVIFEVKELSRYIDQIDENLTWSQFVLELSILRLLLYPIFREVQNSGGVPLHSGLAAWNGMGVLLIGDSGIGKSTCCSRFPEPWNAMCDDETLVIRAGDRRYLCHPFPTWSNLLRREGRASWKVEERVPLSAVFILRQSPVDGLIPLPRERAAFLLARSALQLWRLPRETFLNLMDNEEWPRRRQIFNNSYSIAAAVPTYILQVSLAGRFWEKIEGVLTGLGRGTTTTALDEAGPK